MNPQYMNQGPGYGTGPPGPTGGRPPQYNGTAPGYGPPPGGHPQSQMQPGYAGPKSLATNSTTNGPQMMPPPPPQGDQNPMRGSFGGALPPGPQPGISNSYAPQPGPPPGMANPGQVVNAMGAINLSGQQNIHHNQMGPPTKSKSAVPQPMGSGPPTSTLQNSYPQPISEPSRMPPPVSGGYRGPQVSQTPTPSSMASQPPSSHGVPSGQQQMGPHYGGPEVPPMGHPPSGLPPGPQQIAPPHSSVSQSSQHAGHPPPPVPMGPPMTGVPPSSMHPGSQQSMPPAAQPMTMPPTAQPMGVPPTAQPMSMPPGLQSMGMPPSSMPGGPASPTYGMPPASSAAGMPPMSGLQALPPMPAAPPGAYGAPQSSGPPSPGTQMPGPAGFPGPRPVTPSAGGSASMTGQAQQPRRLDPDQMPSPIQVIEDDRRNRSGAFPTGQRGVVPPLVTTDFFSEDQGNAGARYIRSSMYNIPCTSDMLKQSRLPIVLSISPFPRLHPQESVPPLVDLGQLGPVRCNRCKAYMCPYMQFVDGGRRFQCSFCNCSTEVPPEYFAHLDHTGRRLDCYDRPELCLGTYEFAATEDYCKNNILPKAPAFIFMIDVSYNSVKSGFVQLICNRLKDEVLKNLPKEAGAEESEIHVGFVTYAKELHFYNVKGSLAQPQMLVVSDVQDVFVPLLDGFLVKLSESESVIDSLLAQIPEMFAESRETEVVLGPVMQAGLDALRSSERTGKLIVFHSSLPTAEAPGKLKNRDDRKLLGTDKEKTILTPQSNFYTKLGQECVAAGCSVDLYLLPNSYIDVATVGEVPRLTGGSLYKYMYFQADLDGSRFMADLRENCMKPIAFDAIMRVRTSTGIRPTDFYGNFYMANTTDVEMASVDSDKSVTVEIKHDDKLSESEGACVQAAILYTSVSGQRRLRVINLSFNCCTQMADLFRNCELDALLNYMSKHAIRQSLNTSPKTVREELTDQCAHILSCYRKNCASPSAPGQLILPECMKLLPVYCNCLIKSNIMQGGSEVSTDERSFLMQAVNSMPVEQSAVFFYPRLLPLHDLDLDSTDMPCAIRCSYERLSDHGVYLLENGLVMFLWIGLNVNPTWVQSVFSVQSAAQIDIDRTHLADLDNPQSRRVRRIVKAIREERYRNLKLVIVRQRDKLEPIFQQYLVEDRGANGTASYVDFLCHIHKEIRRLLS